jgi:hypothetical protein
MDPEHRQPAIATLFVSPVGTPTTAPTTAPTTVAGPAMADSDEDLWLERELEYSELGGEG